MADAYYIGTEAADYVVLPAPAEFGIAAHEFAHAVLHSKGTALPDWLSEGLAEVFSTVRVTSGGFEFGGVPRMREETLRHHSRVPLSELLKSTGPAGFRDSRDAAAIFYAESWALADMLISSPAYGDLDRLFSALGSGKPSRQALEDVYGRPLATVENNLQDWIVRRSSPVHPVLGATVSGQSTIPIRLSDREAGMLLADLLIANGEWSRAERTYQQLLLQHPNDPMLLASTGTLALRRGIKSEALEQWRKAIDGGATDSALLYRFALLAEEVGLPPEDVAQALEKAIAAKPDFPDARYRLALIESNRGNYQSAVSQLQAMGPPSAARAYSYWSAMASCLSELGQTDEAVNAAHRAVASARTSDEQGIARALEYTAKTDFHIQFERAANGQMQAVSIRTPHGAEWNPFIEAGDQIERASGQLLSVQCSGGKLVSFSVSTSKGSIVLEVPDPTHVLMRNSPPEFSCGPQQAKTVKVEYAQSNGKRGALLRGMEFQ